MSRSKKYSVLILFLTILQFENILFAQHPIFPGILPITGTNFVYDGTLKFKTGGPFIEDPYESFTADWVDDYIDYHFLPDNDALEFINFRFLSPNGYDPLRSEGYPLIIMLHGAGESGRSWLPNWSFSPDDDAYDNNGRQLIHGGWKHWHAVREGYHPSRPTASWTNEWSFDGFVLFPQVANSGTWPAGKVSDVGELVEDLAGAFNIDLNRIYVHGLSNGAKGVFRFIEQRPDLIAASSPHSGAGVDSLPNVANIPMFIVNGALDSNPGPGYVNLTISNLELHGADFLNLPVGSAGEINEDPYYSDQEKYKSRHWLIGDDRHGIWNEAYDRRDFFQWFLSKSKRNIFVIGGDTVFCPGASINVELRLSPQFKDYQWLKDGVEIGDDTWKYTATDFGIYQLMYSRIDNPTVSDWEYSNTVQISPYGGGVAPSLIANSSVYLPSHVETVNQTTLEVVEDANQYVWYKDGELISGENGKQLVVSESGSYSASMEVPGGCYSITSNTLTVKFENDLGVPSNPSDLVLLSNTEYSIQVGWQDNSNNEDGFEMYIGQTATGPFDLVFIDPGVNSHTISNLAPGNNYYIYLRAFNDKGVSDYISVIANTLGDIEIPTVPENISYSSYPRRISLVWDEAYDNIGIDEYEVFLDGTFLASTKDPTFIINGLIENTLYTIQIRSKDVGGNYSLFSSQISASTLNYEGAGLNYDFYHTTGLSSVNQIESLPIEESGTISNFDISTPRTDYFAFHFYGYIEITTEGLYTFYTESDDGSNLVIDGTEVVSNDGDHGTTEVSGQIELSQGFYPISVLFYEDGGGEELIVSYEHLSISKQQIPDARLHRYSNGTLPSVPSAPNNLDGVVDTNNYSNLTWDDVSNDTGYEVYRSEISGGPYVIIGSVAQDITSFTDVNLDLSTTYFYVVKAINSGGTSISSNEKSLNSLTSLALPNAPDNLQATISSGSNQVELSWDDNSSNESKFIVERSIEDESNYVAIALLDQGSTSFIDVNIMPSMVYFYKIIAQNVTGKSSESNIASVSSPGRIVYINITSYNSNNEGGIWNNFSFLPSTTTGTKLSNLIDNYGENSGLEIELEQSFTDWSTRGVTNNSVFPTNVMVRYHYVENGNIGKFKINNLNTQYTYNIYLLASEEDWQSNYDTKFTINGISKSIVASQNATELVEFNGIVTDNSGSLIIEVSENLPGRGIINGLAIEQGGLINATDYYAKVGSDISKLYNWGSSPDGSGGKLPSFSAENKNLHINGTVHLVSDIAVSGNGSMAIFDDNTTINVWDGVDQMEFTELQIAESTQVDLTIQSDTVNLKLTNGDLVLGDNSVLNIGSNTLTIADNRSLNPNNSTGAIAIKNGSIVINSRDGSTSNLNLVSSEDSIANLTLDLGNGGLLNINDKLNLSSNLKLHSGQINTNGNLTLVSDENIDASILKIESGASINGNVEYQRYWKRPMGSYGFFYLGSPILNQTVQEWVGDFHIQGIGTTSWKNLYKWDETIAQWVGIGSASEPITPGEGINAFMFSRNFTDEFIRYENIGEVWQGDFDFNLTYTSSSDDPGWNLVANPYPSAIDWSKIWTGSYPEMISNNVDAAFYVWDQQNGAYKTWTSATVGIDPYIPSGQGFFIHTNNANPTLTITEDIKVDQKPVFLREGSNDNILQIIASDAEGHSDIIHVSLNENATYGFDSKFDALKLLGNYINLSSVGQNNEKLAINALPEGDLAYTIPLIFETSGTGSFSFTFNNVKSFGDSHQIYFTDKYLNEIREIEEGFVYQFEIGDDLALSGETRFMIGINAVPLKVEVKGMIKDVYGASITDVKIVANNVDNGETIIAASSKDGDFDIELTADENYILDPLKSDQYSFNQVNIIDYLVLKWFLKGWFNINDYEYLSSDVDQSGIIDKQDLKSLRQLIKKSRFRDQKFEYNFISDDYSLTEEGFSYKIDKGLMIKPIDFESSPLNLTGIIPGDVYQDKRTKNKRQAVQTDPVVFTIGKIREESGHLIIPIYGQNFINVSGFQVELKGNISGIIEESITFDETNANEINKEQNLFWTSETESPVSLSDGSLLFNIVIENEPQALDQIVSDLISTDHIAVNTDLQTQNLKFEDLTELTMLGNSYLGAYPNPYSNDIKFRISIVQPESVKFTLYNSNGMLIHQIEKEIPVGLYELDLERDLNFSRSLPKGLTILNIQINNTIITDKLIRN